MITAGILIILSLAFLKRRWKWLKEFPANNGDDVMGKNGLPVSYKQPWHALTVFVSTVLRLPFWFTGAGTSPYHGSGIKIPRIPAVLASVFVLVGAIAAFYWFPVPVMLIFLGPWLVYLVCPVPDQLIEYRNYSSTAGFALLGAWTLDSIPFGWYLLIPMMAWTAFLAHAWSDPVEMWSSARRKTSGDPSRALQDLGAHWRLAGQLWPAEQCLLQAIEVNPNLGPALNNLGWVYADQGKLPEAVRYLEMCIERCPQSSDGWISLGIIYERDKQPEKAMAAYYRLIEMEPSSHPAMNRIGLIHFYAKRREEALKWFQMALTLLPNHEPYIYNVGIAWKWLGKQAEFSACVGRFGGKPVQVTSEMIRPDYGG